MASKSIFAFVSLFLMAGGLLLMFLILLGGVTNHNPVSQFYFLEVNTAGIPTGPHPTARWTYWNLCPVGSNGRNKCGTVHPAFPLDPPSHRNFDTTKDIPKEFIGTGEYYYLTRFMFAFMLIALFFAVCSFFTGMLALCSRIGSYLSGLLGMLAVFFQTLNASLMTAAYVIGRDNFRKNGQTAHIGNYAFGFEWAAWACFLIATILYCVGGRSRRNETSYGSNKGGGLFGGKRSKSTKSTRSRGSFIDGDRKTYESA